MYYPMTGNENFSCNAPLMGTVPLETVPVYSVDARLVPVKTKFICQRFTK